jgi:hypothetical protein
VVPADCFSLAGPRASLSTRARAKWCTSGRYSELKIVVLVFFCVVECVCGPFTCLSFCANGEESELISRFCICVDLLMWLLSLTTAFLGA